MSLEGVCGGEGRCPVCDFERARSRGLVSISSFISNTVWFLDEPADPTSWSDCVAGTGTGEITGPPDSDTLALQTAAAVDPNPSLPVEPRPKQSYAEWLADATELIEQHRRRRE